MASTLIGKGTSGNVYYPSLHCLPPAVAPTGKIVSKLLPNAAAAAELRAAAIVRGKPWARVPIRSCAWNGVGASPTSNYNTLLFSEFGGKSMKEITESEWTAAIAHTYLDFVDEVISWMDTNKCVQGDLTLYNTLWDGTRFYLIDFERARCFTESGNEEEDAEMEMLEAGSRLEEKTYLYTNLLEVLPEEIAKVKDVRDRITAGLSTLGVDVKSNASYNGLREEVLQRAKENAAMNKTQRGVQRKRTRRALRTKRTRRTRRVFL